MKLLHWRAIAIQVSAVLFTFLVGDHVLAFEGLPQFRRIAINAESTFEACTTVDVNHDGQLDIVSGGWWYAAPDWKRHFLRDVEEIRGRYDDYSNLPLDVNRDGWVDHISANYRSQKIYWIEHPGAKLGPWKVHEIAQPGPMETARLADVDGDGTLDLLPNGTKFAAWWELRREPTKSPAENYAWVRHELPIEAAGHGIGMGDIDGDGRKDIIVAKGWLKAPEDRRRERWTWMPEFTMHRDCSLPILVFDVDGDGDNDIVWGRGHRTGLYWYEQIHNTTANAPVRDWQLHAIDTSWSQAHSLLFGDLNNDGRPEVIAGKRALGHDGKDPGELNPMMICAYQFEPKTRAWTRNLISRDFYAGFGLNPELADIDHDGDVDLIAPGRTGLFLFENLLEDADAEKAAGLTKSPSAGLSTRSQLMTFTSAEGKLQQVTNQAEWARRRADIVENLQAVMGPLPDSSRRVPLDVQVLEEVETPKYIRRKLTFAVEPGDRVPAYLLLPKGRTDAGPAMLCLHQTTQAGKDEPAGLTGHDHLHYAHELAERGYVCLVPDYPSFGEYEYDFSNATHGYDSGSMKAVWNNIRAIDVLETLPEVDRDRIGCIGHSLGAHNALFTAVFDLRIAAVVSSCGFTSLTHDDVASWSGPRYMPRIRNVFHNNASEVPVDFPELVAALAPRPIFVNAPLKDADFAVAGVRELADRIGPVYTLHAAADDAQFTYPNAPHDFPDEVRHAAYRWLDKKLGR